MKKKLIVATVGFLFALLVAEICASQLNLGIVPRSEVRKLRTFLRNGPPIYRPHPYAGFVVKSPVVPTPERPVDWSFDLPDDPDALRIACLGGSTTWHNSPLFLKEDLEARTGRALHVMNWGVPGWTTQETMVNYFTNVQDYAPDIVILHHAANDVAPRLQDGFRNDYAHFRKVWTPVVFSGFERFMIRASTLYSIYFIKSGTHGRELSDYVGHPRSGLVRGGPVEPYPTGTEVAFRRNIATIAEHATNHGARVMLMTMPYDLRTAGNAKDPSSPPSVLWAAIITEHNEILRELAREHGYLLVDAEAWVKENPDTVLPLFRKGDNIHFDTPGVRARAKLMADALIEAAWLE